MQKGEHLELNVPAPVRASAADAINPTKDGTYTNVSLTVIPAQGKNWHAGGRTAREADLTVILKNNRRAGEFTGRTDGSPRLPGEGYVQLLEPATSGRAARLGGVGPGFCFLRPIIIATISTAPTGITAFFQ